jgi:Na+:H+ antiporter, NhaA family
MNFIIGSFQRFVRAEAFAGFLLVIFAIFAFAWANSGFAPSYMALRELPISLSMGNWKLENSLEHWVNDGLMALFFLIVGLEIKRELIGGELSNPRQASLAIFAALGGMVIPALLFIIFNLGTSGARGWGVPMATDIAFALGVLSLLGNRVPVSLKVFLTALAIVDDLGAVLVIAVFYTSNLNVTMLALAALCWVTAILLGRLKVRWLSAYGLVGILLWYFTLESGIHATVAGVLLAFTIPIRINPSNSEPNSTTSNLIPDEEIHSPLHRLEHLLAPYVTYLVLPIFALINAGVAVNTALTGGVNGIMLGVATGLLFGKPIGITVFTWLAVRLGWAQLPVGVTLKQVAGVSVLGGIGFTMAIFIATLAFNETGLNQAKFGILLASLVSALVGLTILSRLLPSTASDN